MKPYWRMTAVAVAVLALLTPVALAAHHGASHARTLQTSQWLAVRSTGPDPVLMGDTALEATHDFAPAKSAVAYKVIAGITGTVTDIEVYVDGRNGATKLYAGLYTNNASNKPRTLLTSGSKTPLTSNAWNDVAVTHVNVTAGTSYHLAILGTGGTLKVLDHFNGGATWATGSTLNSLPSTYPSSTQFQVAPISAYVNGTVAAPPPTAAFTYSPSTPVTGQKITFDGTGSTCNATPCSYTWTDLGPDGPGGSNYPLGTGQTLNFTFQVAGTKYVQLKVTDANGQTATAEHDISVTSAPPAPPVNTVAPVASAPNGTDVGDAVSTTSGTWNPSGTASVQWQRCSGGTCSDITGATSSGYTLTSHDVNDTVRSVVTETNSAGSAAANSNELGPVTTPPPPQSTVTYTGPAAISDISNLTADTTLSNVAGVTWLLDGQPIGTASVAPYTFDVNAALLSGGAHTMTVQAVDQDGTRTTSPGVAVTVDTSAPSGATHLTGTSGALTLAANQTVYGDGSSTVINGTVTMAAGSRLENVVVNGTVTASNATNARLQQATINPPSSASQAVLNNSAAGFSMQDSTINCNAATGTIKGTTNGNFDATSDNVIFARDTISNCGGDGIWMAATSEPAQTDSTTQIVNLLVLDNNISGANGPYDNGTEARGFVGGGYRGNFIGNTVTGATTDAVEPIRNAYQMHFAHNTLSGSPTGFYLEHYADASVFEYNTVQADVQAFNIEWIAGSNPPRSTANAKILNNQIAAPVGVFADAGSTGIETANNTITTGSLPTIVYQGSINGSIHDNMICTTQTGNPVSVYANAGYDPTAPGTLTTQSNNTLSTCGNPPPPPPDCDLSATPATFASQVAAATAGQTVCLASGS